MRHLERDLETCGDVDGPTPKSDKGDVGPTADNQELWRLVTGAAKVNKAAHAASDPSWRRDLFKEKDRLLSAAIVSAGRGRLWASYQFRGNGPGFLVLVAFFVPRCGQRNFHIPFDRLSPEARALIINDFGRPPERV